MTLQGTIVVLKGGPGSEREVSLVSARSVAGALAKLPGVEVVEVDLRDSDFELPAGVELAFNVVHGTFGEDGQLQEELERRGIAYTGARAGSSRLAFDKLASKERFALCGVRTPRWFAWDLTRAEPPGMEFPFVAKPLREGSSVGVHIVRTEADWRAAQEDLTRFGETALVEEHIAGKELTVGILDDAALPVVHIAPRSGFYDMNNKYPWLSKSGGSDYYVPASLSELATAEVQAQALAAHRALGVEVYSRVDVLLGPGDVPYVLEVNTIPGMTESSLLPKAAAAAGLDFSALCVRIAEASLELRRT
ncbi:MAG TPA: D-alanine--D-alanine ligase [Verrucomicrobiales bacterium]|nr:D-alanine--D-alanine ligase [Verrucomicrobiales bacterium]